MPKKVQTKNPIQEKLSMKTTEDNNAKDAQEVQKVKTRISCRAEGAQSVWIAGSFNDWKPEPMSRLKDGSYKLVKSLDQGQEYSFRYLLDEDKPNGLVKSTAHKAIIVFKENEIDQVRLYGSPTSEYYPEGKVEGLERTFTLPKFVLKENRPVKKDFFNHSEENE